MKELKMEAGLRLLIVFTAAVGMTKAFEHSYEASGVVCNMCPPGSYVAQHCTQDFTNSTCVSCPAHQFMAHWNKESHCKACQIANCPPQGEEVHACTPTTDRLCICQPGFHRYPLDPIDPQFECRRHTRCLADEGVLTYGNHSHDTQCEKCAEGEEFVNATDPQRPLCQKCSGCPAGGITLLNCSLEADTVCNSTVIIVDINATATTAQPPQESDSLGEGLIAVIVLCVILVIAIIIGCILYHKRNWWRGRNKPEEVDGLDNEERQELKPITSTDSWTEQMIERDVFTFLAPRLGAEWRLFIPRLPGWPATTSVQSLMDYKIEEQGLVQNRILGCLQEWKKQVDPRFVCRDSIVNTLRAVDKGGLAEELDIAMNSTSSSAPVINGNGNRNP